MNARRVQDYERAVLHGQILAFHQCGFRLREIAREVGITYSAVRKILRKDRVGALRLRIPIGRPRKTTLRADRFLTRLARNNHLLSATELLEMWRERVSKYTIYRRLRQAGLHRYRLYKVPCLPRVHAENRYRWAQGKVLYRELQWDRIIWSDKSRFCLRMYGGREEGTD